MANKLDLDDLRIKVEELGEKQDKQLEVLHDLKISVVKQEATFEAHNRQDEQNYSQIASMNEKLGDYNNLLSIHIEGVNQLRHMNELLERKIEADKESMEKYISILNQRLEILEIPFKWMSVSKNYIIMFAKVAGAIMAVAAFLKWVVKAF